MTESLEECVARIVQQEIRSDVSQLVLTLASHYNLQPRANHEKDAAPLVDLGDQAIELAAPVNDWEEAARQAGWTARPATISENGVKSDPCVVRGTVEEDPEYAAGFKYAENWHEACEEDGLGPYQWEVYEHWAVSLPLGEKLAAKGEKVDFDFAGLVVWARTNTGQAIEADSVIEAIAADIVAAGKE